MVADLTNAKGNDRLNHAKFADNPILVQLLGERLRTPAALIDETAGPAQPINDLGEGVGQAVGSVAQIIITTPFKVLSVATGGR